MRQRQARGSDYRGRGQAGLFTNGVWNCDCNPRLPAERFKVKKPGKNHGRWFYTCQQKESSRCGFFLWEEAAKPREARTVLSNSRNEPMHKTVDCQGECYTGHNDSTGERCLLVRSRQPPAGAQNSESRSPSPQSSPIRAKHGTKRRMEDTDSENEGKDSFSWSLTGADEQELARVADAATNYQTPVKAARIGLYDTPQTNTRTAPRKLPWTEPYPKPPSTPISSLKKNLLDDYFTTPSKPSSNLAEDWRPTGSTTQDQMVAAAPETPPTLSTPAVGPTSPSPQTRYRDALHNPADAMSSLTAEVTRELAGLDVPAETMSRLRSILSKHDLRTQGVTKGRDISRLALKSKEARIAELEAKVARLEAESQVDRGAIRLLKVGRET